MTSSEGKGGSAPPLIKHHHRISSSITSGPPFASSGKSPPLLPPPWVSNLPSLTLFVVERHKKVVEGGLRQAQEGRRSTAIQVVPSRVLDCVHVARLTNFCLCCQGKMPRHLRTPSSNTINERAHRTRTQPSTI